MAGAPAIYLAGSAVAVSLPLVDQAGAPFTATKIQCRVLDGANKVLLDEDIAHEAGAESISFTLPSALTALEAGRTRDIRDIEFACVTGDGRIVLLAMTIGVTARDALVVPDNSFLTFAEAQMLAFTIPALDEWYLASREARVQALIEAKFRLARRRYRPLLEEDQNYIHDFNAPGRLDTISLQQLNALDPRFMQALRRAQLFEANAILTGDSVDAPDDRLVSKTVGESTEVWRDGAPMTTFICPRAMRELAPYLISDVRIARA